MKAILFDLDDTLYPEKDFTYSGLRVVSDYLSSKYNYDKEFIISRLEDLLESGAKPKIFDILLKSFGMYTEERVKLLVYLYRTHKPDIRLHRDVLPSLEQLKSNNYFIGLITDGIGSVQRRKIEALEIEDMFDLIICTDEIGVQYWKPSTVSFKIALDYFGVESREAAYIGNDSNKDFIGPNTLGMLTIKIEREHPRIPLMNVSLIGSADATFSNLEDIISFLSSTDLFTPKNLDGEMLG